MQFDGKAGDEARAFAEPWLAAWTGNNPELLTSFYSEDAFYSDPAVPEGISGRPELLTYFKKLLGYNPNWVWKHRGSIPLEDGFLNKWHASIPVGDKTIEVDGACTIQIRDGHICSNEVFFDRFELLTAVELEKERRAV